MMWPTERDEEAGGRGGSSGGCPGGEGGEHGELHLPTSKQVTLGKASRAGNVKEGRKETEVQAGLGWRIKNLVGGDEGSWDCIWLVSCLPACLGQRSAGESGSGTRGGRLQPGLPRAGPGGATLRFRTLGPARVERACVQRVGLNEVCTWLPFCFGVEEAWRWWFCPNVRHRKHVLRRGGVSSSSESPVPRSLTGW